MNLRAMKLVKHTILEGLSSSVKPRDLQHDHKWSRAVFSQFLTSKPLVQLKSKYFCELENGKQNGWVFLVILCFWKSDFY